MPKINSRDKGHNYERELVHIFKAAGFSTAKRGLQYQTNSAVPDVDVPIYWIEAKRGKKPNVRKALEQAQKDTDGRIPVAIIRDDRCPAFVVMNLDHWLQLVTK